jgi:hypothetical protein
VVFGGVDDHAVQVEKHGLQLHGHRSSSCGGSF